MAFIDKFARRLNSNETSDKPRINEVSKKPSMSSAFKRTVRPPANAENTPRRTERVDNSYYAHKDIIRHLRSLIRQKRRLDVQILLLTRVQYREEQELINMCTEADDLLHEIRCVVNNWRDDFFDNENERKTAQYIQYRLQQSTKNDVLWTQMKPWRTRMIQNVEFAS